jgi:predicted nicotinamide N-methyase
VRNRPRGRDRKRAPADSGLDPATFIRDNLTLGPARLLPEIQLYAAHPASGLWRLVGRGETDAPPYWAYPWAGGTALARYILDRPDTVAGLRVLDLGAGSGVVAIAAAKAGAREVAAVDIDRNAVAAIGLNAAANDVKIEARRGNPIKDAPPCVDLIAIGDLFYERALAAEVTEFLERCAVAAVKILIGDPFRAHLPRERLRLIAEYATPDFGDAKEAAIRRGGVFAFEAAPR